MSSFRSRMNEYNPHSIAGTKTSPHTGQIITSSGNPALDELLGGGIPINSIILIEEDKHCIYSKVLYKYFLAESIALNLRIFLACLDERPEEILKTLPKPFLLNRIPEDLMIDTTSLRIAWRYNDLPYLNVDKKTTETTHYDLQVNEANERYPNKVLWSGGEDSLTETASEEESPEQKETECAEDDDTKEDGQADGIPLPTPATSAPKSSFFTNKRYQNLLESISNETGTGDLQRICIPSLGSPLWYDENFGKDLLKFLTILRVLVQSHPGACFLTMPMHLIAKHDETLVPKIRNLVDYSLELESFAGSDREKNPAFKQYHGLVHFRKMSAINSLALIQQSDLAFRLEQRKFVIEKFHLPPEMKIIAEQNTEDDASSAATAGCGGAANKLDF